MSHVMFHDRMCARFPMYVHVDDEMTHRDEELESQPVVPAPASTATSTSTSTHQLNTAMGHMTLQDEQRQRHMDGNAQMS